MKISIYDTNDEMSKAAAELVAKQLAQKPASVICFPSGDSPTGMLNYIVQWANDGKIDLNQSFFIGLDEWVGMDENDQGSCKYYLKHNFFDKLNTKLTNITLFDAKAEDLDAECERMNNFISSKGGLDIMMVGIGMNGHLGLNEPGTPFDLYAHRSELDPVTVQVGQKYFTKETALTEGITLGLKHLAEAGKAVLIATGAKKADIIHESLQGLVGTEVPASILQTLSNAFILLDKDAASELEHGA
ncbi:MULTISPECIES: glucosamine-6-phosphate deaminase [unclassified Mucilaginibacter]|uniref:6-phosphogluconolactonase n=1 Tax=unclassified Mucilaginibacter TaxID=2617802 RepID=UPI002AC98749|nr:MULTISPECIES: glucosamine-6-phosphate deaminase [unclassified Mucilaginibacter]MEB0260932.1 glucosamine-6-phosphate deaminase [Mucilaginibacter sp. 10I4]MEB0279526.1 glucosamine-6-phosphate deaminase [Mucilaginibacter sp. 10B2]MEB0302271.1 glucosamine-6-phosphate deaminase [Mucilaginibacter sp. 5C4]WPX22606.1 glucosamine-6-phosphate deaminase [Mucilaginibacter sp. 5C4]